MKFTDEGIDISLCDLELSNAFLSFVVILKDETNKTFSSEKQLLKVKMKIDLIDEWNLNFFN